MEWNWSVALLPVPAWWQIRGFRVNIRADSYLGPILPGLRAEYHPCRLGLGDHFQSGYFRFRCVQEGGAGRQHESRLASGSYKIRFLHVESAIIRKICQITLRTGNYA